MTDIFLDTVGLIAVWDESDQWHPAATEAYKQLLASGRRLVTTALVLLECGNAAARRPYRRRVHPLRQALALEGLLIRATDEDMAAAWTVYDREGPGQAEIIDHVSFVVMRRLGLAEAFTNDRHFKSSGFLTLF